MVLSRTFALFLLLPSVKSFSPTSPTIRNNVLHADNILESKRFDCEDGGSSDDSNTPTGRLDATPSATRHTRRSLLLKGAAAAGGISAASFSTGVPEARAEITKESEWPLWLALPVAPYARRKTLRREVVPGRVWLFDQLIGIYYVHVPIRMTVVALAGDGGGLLVYAPVAPTAECLALLREIADVHGPVRHIILPSVAVEHKVNAGPFARNFPEAGFYVTDQQYSFPIGLPNAFLGLPSWTKPLPSSSKDAPDLFGAEFEFEVLTVKPGPGSMFQDVALFHKPTKSLLLCDAIFATTSEPPFILTGEPEYTRALLFHARDSKDEIVVDTPEARRKGWRRIVLLFNFFFPGSGKGDLGPGPVLQALKTPTYNNGWGGWKPFSWDADSEVLDFDTFSAGGKPTVLPIIQIILARGPRAVTAWLDTVTRWDFTRVIPAHLDAPLDLGPEQFARAFDFVKSGRNEVRFCDEDVAFLRKAEEGFLSFSVYKSSLGPLRGGKGPCGLKRPQS